MIRFLYFSPAAIHGSGVRDLDRKEEGIDRNRFLRPLEQFDKITLRGQQEYDATSIERGSGNGSAQGHAPLPSATREFSIQILDLITQMIHAAPAAADDGIDGAVLTKGLHQLDQRVALHAGKADRHPLDRVRDLGANGKRRKNRPKEVFDETVDIGGGVTHVVKAHHPASGLLDHGFSYRVTPRLAASCNASVTSCALVANSGTLWNRHSRNWSGPMMSRSFHMLRFHLNPLRRKVNGISSVPSIR